MIKLLICFCLLLSLQAKTPLREYTTSFSLRVENRLTKPLENAVTHHTTGETIQLMDSVAAGAEALFISANRDGVSDLTTSGLISFQLTDRNSSDFSDLGVNYYLTLLWSVPISDTRNVMKLAITTSDAQQDGLYNDLLNDNVETFSVEAGNSWQIWKPNFANIEIKVFYNNEYLANASITVIRRTPDFPASLMILPLNSQGDEDTVLELRNGQIQGGVRETLRPPRQLWRVLRAYDDVFYIVNQEGNQFIYADPVYPTAGEIFVSGFQPKNSNNLWEIKEVAYGFTIRALSTNLFWNINSEGEIVLTPLVGSLNAKSVNIFTIEEQQDDFLLEDSFSVLTITNPSDSLALAASIFSSSVQLQSSQLPYDHFWLMKRVSNGKYILQDFDTHLTLEAIDSNTVQVNFFVPKDDPKADSQLWSIVRGQGDNNFTIESVAYPGSFLSVSGLGVVLGSSYGLRIERLDSFRNVVQKGKASSLTGKDGNTLTYDVSGPTGSIPEFVHLNHRFNFSSGVLTQITPLAAHSEERLAVTGEDSSLVWQEGSSDVWRVIPAPHYYGILIQLRNERTGVYLTSAFPDFTTVPTADESYETTYFKVYSLDILPPQIQWDRLSPLVISPPEGKLALSANRLIQQQGHLTLNEDFDLFWNAQHIDADIFTLQKSKTPKQFLSGGSNLLKDVGQHEYPRTILWRITKDTDGSVQLLNLDNGQVGFLNHGCNVQENLTTTAASETCTHFDLERVDDFVPFNQPFNTTYFNLLNLKIGSSDLALDANIQQQLQINQPNQNRTQDWEFKQLTVNNQNVYIIWNRIIDGALTVSAEGALIYYVLYVFHETNQNQLWTITQHAKFSNVLRIQSLFEPTLYLTSSDSNLTGASWRVQTGPSQGLIPTIGLQATEPRFADFTTSKITIARTVFQYVLLNSDGKQTHATVAPNTNVQWKLIQAGTYYRIQNVATGYYLSYKTSSDPAAHHITTEPTISTANSQLWEITPDFQYNNLMYIFKNVQAGRVLTVPNPTDIGVQVLLMTQQPGWWTQRFRLTWIE